MRALMALVLMTLQRGPAAIAHAHQLLEAVAVVMVTATLVKERPDVSFAPRPEISCACLQCMNTASVSGPGLQTKTWHELKLKSTNPCQVGRTLQYSSHRVIVLVPQALLEHPGLSVLLVVL